MKKIKIVLALVAFYFLFSAAWQVGSCELSNIEFKDDLQDMTQQLGLQAGSNSTQNYSDDDLRKSILRKAEKYDIPLAPDSVTVARTGYGGNASVYLEADYSVPIYLPHYTFRMYFNPSSAHKRPASDSSSQQ